MKSKKEPSKDYKGWTVKDQRRTGFFPPQLIFSFFSSPCLNGDLERPTSHSVLHWLVNVGGGSVMIWGCLSKTGIAQMLVYEECINQTVYYVSLVRHLLSSALTIFPNCGLVLLRQCFIPHRQVNVLMEDHKVKTISWPAQK